MRKVMLLIFLHKRTRARARAWKALSSTIVLQMIAASLASYNILTALPFPIPIITRAHMQGIAKLRDRTVLFISPIASTNESVEEFLIVTSGRLITSLRLVRLHVLQTQTSHYRHCSFLI